MEGFKFDFDVGYKGTLSPKMIDNLASAKAKPDIVNEKIKKELEEKWCVGPFDLKPFRMMQLSPLGLVEKKTPGTYRIIHHLFSPEGSSINDGIPEKDSCPVCYHTRCNWNNTGSRAPQLLRKNRYK